MSVVFETRRTPLESLFEIGRVTPDECGLVYDQESGALYLPPHSEMKYADPYRRVPDPTGLRAALLAIIEKEPRSWSGHGFGISHQNSGTETFHLDGLGGNPGPNRIVLVAGRPGSGTQFYPPNFQIDPWRLYFVSGNILHRAPFGFTEISGPDPTRRRVHYHWQFNETLVIRTFRLDRGLSCTGAP